MAGDGAAATCELGAVRRYRKHRGFVKSLCLTATLLLVIGFYVIPSVVREQVANLASGYNSDLGSRRHLLSLQGSAETWAHNVTCNNFGHYKDPCDFVQHAEECQNDDGFVNYLVLPYCQLHNVPGACVILVLWLVILFIALGATAEEFFCPALSVISDTLKLSHNVAGVTFLALGNGAPDIFSVFSAFTADKAYLAIGELYGAGVFVTTVVVGTVSIVVPFTVTRRPFVRDVSVYLIAATWTFVVLWDEEIHLGEAVGYIGIYIMYVLVVIIGRKIYQGRKPSQVDKVAEKKERAREEELIAHPPHVHTTQHSLSEALDLTDMIGIAPINTSAAKKSHITHIFDDDEDEDDDNTESTALLKGSDVPLLPTRPKAEIDQVQQFLDAINPIDVEEFKAAKWYNKIYAIVQAPITFLLTITIPVVDYDEEDEKWRRPLALLQCITAPLWFVVGAQLAFININDVFPVWGVAAIFGIICSLIVYTTSRVSEPPKYHVLFAFMGFIVAVIWIYIVANEIVNLLQTLGRVMGIGDAILGLTVLAWGNSIGDFVSNLTVARQGFPQMAVGACYGGPALNMLLGIGASALSNCIKSNPYKLVGEKFQLFQLKVSASFLILSLLSSVIWIPTHGFSSGKRYGIYLLCLYLVFMITSLVFEFVHPV